MKKTTKIVLVALLGMAVATTVGLYFRSKSYLKEIKYGISTGVKLLRIGLKDIQILLPIWLYNPTPINIVVSNLDLRIYMNGYYVSTITSPKSYQLTSGQKSTYPLIISIKTGDVLNLLENEGQIINDQDWLSKVIIRVEGTVTVDLGLFRLNRKKIFIEDSLKKYVG